MASPSSPTVLSRLTGRGEAVQFGVVLVERLAVARRLAQRSTKAGRAVAGDADEAGLLVEGTADGLADPEGGVGGELEATAPVELVDGVLEAEVALLDEVEQIHALGKGIAAGDTDHEAQVGADEPILGLGGGRHLVLEGHALLARGELLGGFATGLDDARQLTFVFGGEQSHLADVVQVESDGVIHVGYNRSFVRWIPTGSVPYGTLQRPAGSRTCHERDCRGELIGCVGRRRRGLSSETFVRKPTETVKSGVCGGQLTVTDLSSTSGVGFAEFSSGARKMVDRARVSRATTVRVTRDSSDEP